MKELNIKRLLTFIFGTCGMLGALGFVSSLIYLGINSGRDSYEIGTIAGISLVLALFGLKATVCISEMFD